MSDTRTNPSPEELPDTCPHPTVIAHYELGEKLGEGGMGAVYKGWHPKLKRFGAVKLLPAELMQNQSLVARFEHEIALIAKLNHPHVVQTYDAGEEAGLHYLVLEYLEGTDLSKLVKQKGPLSVENAVAAIRQAALGLQHAHEKGLVHRDIKPANLMLHRPECGARGSRATTPSSPADTKTQTDAREPRAPQPAVIKVMDFGLALLTDGNSLTDLTKSGQIMGTPEYMAPEQWESTHSVDLRADLYSLGATLHFLLTGRSPYRRSETTTVMHLMKSHALDPIPDLTALRPEVPPEVNALFQRLLAKSPADRPASALEVVREIDAWKRRGQAPQNSNLAGPSVGPEQSSTPPILNFAVPDPSPKTVSDFFEELQATQPLPSIAESPSPHHIAKSHWLRSPRLLAFAALAVVLLVGVLLLQLRTPVGTIVLEVDREAAAGAVVSVDGQQKLTIQTGQAEPILEVPADEKEHALKVTKGGFETFTEKFTAKAGKQTVSIRLERKRSEQKGAKATGPQKLAFAKDVATDPDREVAEWVLSIGGRLQLFDPNNPSAGLELSVTDRSQLPSGSFELKGVELKKSRVTDNDLRRFTGLRELSWIGLDGASITNAGLQNLGELPRLDQLVLNNIKADAVGVCSLTRFQTLRTLNLGGLPITDDDVRDLMVRLPNLNGVFASRTLVTDQGLRYLAQTEQFKAGLFHNISDDGVAPLLNNSRLIVIQLQDCRLTLAGVKTLATCFNLTELTLTHNPEINDACVAEIAKLSKLKQMDLGGSSITDACVPDLKKLRQLNKLWLRPTRLTAKAIAELHTALPNCRITWDGGVVEPQ